MISAAILVLLGGVFIRSAFKSVRDNDGALIVGAMFILVALIVLPSIGAEASSKREEISRAKLISYSEDTPSGDHVYILDRQHIGSWGNEIVHSYYIQTLDSRLVPKEIPLGQYLPRKCDWEKITNPPQWITYTYRLIHPSMALWIIWYPGTPSCITGDVQTMIGERKPTE